MVINFNPYLNKKDPKTTYAKSVFGSIKPGLQSMVPTPKKTSPFDIAPSFKPSYQNIARGSSYNPNPFKAPVTSAGSQTTAQTGGTVTPNQVSSMNAGATDPNRNAFIAKTVADMAGRNGGATQETPATPKEEYMSELQRAQKELDDFRYSQQLGERGIENKVIPLEFQTGQLSALRRDASLQEGALETRLGRLQEQEAAKAEAERANIFDLGEGQARYRYNPETGQTELIAERGKTFAPDRSGTASGSDMFGGAKLSTGQKQDVADMLVLQRQIADVQSLAKQLGGFVGAGATTGFINKPLARILGRVRTGAQDIRNNIGQIQGFIAKLRGGTSFTPNEQALLESYTPTIRDSDAVIKSKLTALNNYVNDKIETTLLVSGGSYTAPGQNNIVTAPDGQEIEIID